MSITFTATAADAPEINMANANAAAILELLGFATEQVEVLGHPNSYGEGQTPPTISSADY